MARSRLAQSGGVAGLNTTALVHEGFLRMADHEGLQGGSRGDFFACVGQGLRSVVIDHLRSIGRDKRGGDPLMVTLSAANHLPASQPAATDLSAMDLYEGQAAIKLLRSDLDGAGLAGRFARERAVLARLNHPAVARLLDAGLQDGQAYLVLEHVDGPGLAAHVRQRCPLVAQRVPLMMRIAAAVDHAHAQLIVHRDLKPSDVEANRRKVSG